MLRCSSTSPLVLTALYSVLLSSSSSDLGEGVLADFGAGSHQAFDGDDVRHLLARLSECVGSTGSLLLAFSVTRTPPDTAAKRAMRVF
jgi:hypothetical protein